MYGEGKNWKLFLGLGVVIVLLFFIIFLIVNSGGSDKKGEVEETKKQLTSYASDDNITITNRIIGPVTAPQNHKELEINVTNSQATINIISGYDGNIINSRSYPLTNQAFSEFLSALDKANFTKGNTDKELTNDAGYCATGQRYIFEIRDGSNNIQRFWSTSCGGTKTFRGNPSATLELFQNQIPDFEEITQDLNFSYGSGGGLLL